jgi:hypothetical protein
MFEDMGRKKEKVQLYFTLPYQTKPEEKLLLIKIIGLKNQVVRLI